ncbi:STAS domain-containing protein [Mycobacterium sp.]|uniref:STAS domain-containing protein n=1 Tax=Mycobacterium sp. TaxID=1785 RepID=UPI0025CEAE29|nr:STAS domain-containing protein [Mycobacterium sp.]MBW0011629.1 STAS domain-containing protein [Mycobacterium sp.]
MIEPPLTVSVDVVNQPPVVTAAGDIDLANVEEFKDSLTRAARDTAAIAVDISRIRYCDSATIGALFELAATTAVTLIVSHTGPIRTSLRISGLDRIVAVRVAE